MRARMPTLQLLVLTFFFLILAKLILEQQAQVIVLPALGRPLLFLPSFRQVHDALKVGEAGVTRRVRTKLNGALEKKKRTHHGGLAGRGGGHPHFQRLLIQEVCQEVAAQQVEAIIGHPL
jgi:hypothetical protein